MLDNLSDVNLGAAFDLRQERIERGYTRKGLADLLGLQPDTIRRAEEHANLRPASAKVIADHFGVTVRDVAPELFNHERAA